jgi:hypothetical protein
MLRHDLFRAASLALALGLLAPSAALAAGDPLAACWSKKLKAAGKFSKSVGSCFAKAANRGPFWSPNTLEASFEACGVIALERLTRSWEKAEAKATSQGADACIGAGPDDVAGPLLDPLERALDLALNGMDNPAATAVGAAHRLIGDMVKETGKFADKWLKAEVKYLKKPDSQKRAAARDKARSKFEDKWTKARESAASGSVVFDFDPPMVLILEDIQVAVDLIIAQRLATPLRRTDLNSLPPLSVNPPVPTGGAPATVQVDVPGATNIDLSVSGAGCGALGGASIAGGSLTQTGDVGEFGVCSLRADVTTPGGPVAYERTFTVEPTQLTLPDVRLLSGYYAPGPLPAPSGGGADPEISGVVGPTTLITGGTVQLRIQLVEPTIAERVRRVGVQIGDPAAGHFDAPALVVGDEILIQIQLNQVLQNGTADRDAYIQLADALGSFGPAFLVTFAIQEVGTGDVQVSLSWDTETDVDLHVVDPTGEEIYYGNTSSESGGQLDLDSNAGCGIDGINNENITWPTGMAPSGTYVVRVNFWSDCDLQPANFTVTTNVCGQSQTFFGSFTADQAAGGGLGSGTEMTRFTFDCGFRVRGDAHYEDLAVTQTGLSATPRELPIRFAEAAVVRESDGVTLASAPTRQDGSFDLQFANDGAPGYRVMVRASQDDDFVKQSVADDSEQPYELASALIDETLNPDMMDVQLVATSASAGPAFNIFDAGVSAAAFVRAVHGRTPPLLSWVWGAGQQSDCEGEDASCYDASHSRAHIDEGDEYDDLIVLREFGHHWQFFFSRNQSPGGARDGATRGDPLLAWGEGSATMFAGRVRGTPTVIDTDRGGVVSLTDVDFLDPAIPLGTSDGTQTGDLSEDVVAAILWDLADGGTEPGDTLAREGAVFGAMSYLRSPDNADRGVSGADLVDYLDGWFCLGLGDEGDASSGVQGILEAHGFTAYDFAGPACP